MAPRSRQQLYFGKTLGNWLFIGAGVVALIVIYTWPF